MRSGFADENVKVRHTAQPGIIGEAAGIRYDEFTIPQSVGITGFAGAPGEPAQAQSWMELITPSSATVLASYQHPVWGKYAALTENNVGKGLVTYVGFMPSETMTGAIVRQAVAKAGIAYDSSLKFPTIYKTGVNQLGKTVHYYLNYSGKSAEIGYSQGDGVALLTGQSIKRGERAMLEPWGVLIVEET